MNRSTKFGFILFTLITLALGKQVDLIEPRTTHMNDPHDTMRLATSQKITAQLVGALGYSIEYVPEHSGECKIRSVRDHFRQVDSRNLHEGYYSSVTSMITLKENNLTVFIDDNFYIAVFEIVNNKIEDKVVNRTLLTSNSGSFHETPLLVADENETYVLAITSSNYYFINVSSLKSGNLVFQEIKQSLGQSFVKLEIISDVLFVATRQAGVKAFQINHTTGSANFLYSLFDIQMMCEDFTIERKTKILYLLDFEKGIQVYNISTPKEKPPLYDFIDLSNYSRKNQKIEVENNVILIAFFHRSSNAIAEINYKVHERKFSFLRYFKFKDALIDLKLINEHLIAIGDVFVAVFPVNIHPKLIQSEMNGNIILSPIRRVLEWKGDSFIGLTYNSIILGEVNVDNSDQITCALKESSKLKKLIYRANITSCGSNRQYYDYCTYTKQVNFERMQVIAGEGTAHNLWLVIIALCTIIGIGVVSLQLIKNRKQKTIKFLESEFEKRRSMSALPSQRLSHRVAGSVEPQSDVPVLTQAQLDIVS